jgi:hypothetical protein
MMVVIAFPFDGQSCLREPIRSNCGEAIRHQPPGKAAGPFPPVSLDFNMERSAVVGAGAGGGGEGE